LATGPLARLWPGRTLTCWVPSSNFKETDHLLSFRAKLTWRTQNVYSAREIKKYIYRPDI
ncbi:MAG: hypothetical protein ABSA71_19370, partial [Desulfomonilia bacterium]